MATAKAYDQYEDAALTFSDEEILAHDPQRWAEQRVSELILAKYWPLVRMSELADAAKPGWARQSSSYVRSLCRWYCIAMEIDAPSDTEYTLPDSRNKIGRQVTMMAQSLVPEEFVQAWGAEAHRELTYVVTIGRRCISKSSVTGWDVGTKKLSNKLANCLVREIACAAKLQDLLSHRE